VTPQADGGIATPLRIPAADWLSHFTGLREAGLVWFDFLTAIDRGAQADVVARVAAVDLGRSALVVTTVDEELDSLSGLYAGASWYERETREMFGLRFAGLLDQRPLLHRLFTDPPPLRKQART